MKFVYLILLSFMCILKNFVKSTKFGPMAESLALGDVEYRTEEIHPVNQKDYLYKYKNSKNLKSLNSTLHKINEKKAAKRSLITNHSNYLNALGNSIWILFALILLF